MQDGPAGLLGKRKIRGVLQDGPAGPLGKRKIWSVLSQSLAPASQSIPGVLEYTTTENVQSFRISKDFPLLKVSGFPRMVPLLKRLGGGWRCVRTDGRAGDSELGPRVRTDGRGDPPPHLRPPCASSATLVFIPGIMGGGVGGGFSPESVGRHRMLNLGFHKDFL